MNRNYSQKRLLFTQTAMSVHLGFTGCFLLLFLGVLMAGGGGLTRCFMPMKLCLMVEARLTLYLPHCYMLAVMMFNIFALLRW